MTLAWTLAASNRPVRDRATKALVNLLTGRLAATARLVDGFADVDDPYVVERVYAVAYGVATRSHDPDEVKILAERVYARVFATGAPPVNILLRDYARGVDRAGAIPGGRLSTWTYPAYGRRTTARRRCSRARRTWRRCCQVPEHNPT